MMGRQAVLHVRGGTTVNRQKIGGPSRGFTHAASRAAATCHGPAQTHPRFPRSAQWPIAGRKLVIRCWGEAGWLRHPSTGCSRKALIPLNISSLMVKE